MLILEIKVVEEFICPKDKDAVIEKPDNTVITLQSSIGQDLQYLWTVRWKPLKAPTQRFTLMLWKTVRALQAQLNAPQAEPSVYVIENSELLSGVDYTFYVSEVGTDADPKSFHIDNTQGDQKLLIEGRNDMMSIILVGGQETYVDVEFDLEAQVTACFPTQDYYFIWSITSENGDTVGVSQTDGARLQIPRDTLKAGSTYNVNCQLIQNTDGHHITQTGVAFKVTPRGIEAYFNFDYLVVSTNQAFSMDASIVNHDNFEDIMLEWTCLHENESCAHLGNITGNTILFLEGLPELGELKWCPGPATFANHSHSHKAFAAFVISGTTSTILKGCLMPLFARYYITLMVSVVDTSISTNSTITAVDSDLPVIQIQSVKRLLNEGTMVSLTANVTNVPPTCILTWYFASKEYLYNYVLVNDTCEECQYGEALTESMTIQSLEENFLNELIDYTNETQWRSVTADLQTTVAGRARFIAQCGCSLTFNCDRKGVVYADVNFMVNTSPKTRELMITPETGTALETVFRISTPPASDPDGILRYNFYCRVGVEDSLLLASYVEHRAVETLLPYIDGGTEIWIEVCDVLGACAPTDMKIVDLASGEGRTLSTLIGDAAAHVRRCELLLLTRVVQSAVVTYENTCQLDLLSEFSTALLQSLQTIDKDKCLDRNYENFVTLMTWLQTHDVDTSSIVY
ncbi:uncharacterized protein LOC132902811 [Amyelois transitella]|uniref:uncharacterized protein LOC132902811 n=1 Tax=Amyelois transitella TaxID=680683 RepID=UPI0029903DBE|nr:uncharacterized protein LOC132902811 [Amyelois transitella]